MYIKTDKRLEYLKVKLYLDIWSIWKSIQYIIYQQSIFNINDAFNTWKIK